MLAITSPERREHLFLDTRRRFAEAAFPCSSVRRRRGIDFRGGTARRPAGLKSHTFLMWALHVRFLPWCIQQFARTPRLRVIAWVEDDCTLKPGVTAQQSMRMQSSCKAPAVWLGYTRVKGHPWWGSHFVAISRVGAKKLKDAMGPEAAKAKGTRHPTSYCHGLDSWLRRRLDDQAGRPLVSAPPAPLCYQRGHALQGRR